MANVESRGLDTGVKAVHLLTTGFGEQHREHRYGTALPRMWWVLTSRSWIKVPINAFLIEHRDGLVLFDTGIDPAIASDPRYLSSPFSHCSSDSLNTVPSGPDNLITGGGASLFQCT